MTAIDDVLPRYDVHELHSIAYGRSLEEALATPVASDPVVRLLFRLRGVPAEGTIADLFCRLRFRSTEKRIEAVDDAGRRAFLRYWRIVGPFSAVIRRRWLKQIAQ